MPYIFVNFHKVRINHWQNLKFLEEKEITVKSFVNFYLNIRVDKVWQEKG